MSDIQFNCPACTKSLVIDAKGAGRMVKCMDCGASVQVPSVTANPARQDHVTVPRPDINPMPKVVPVERPLAETKKCPFCGADVGRDDVLCVGCGTNLKTGRRVGQELDAERQASTGARKRQSIFGYSAMNETGRMVEGTIEADSEQETIDQIKSKGLFPTKVWKLGARPVRKQASQPGSSGGAGIFVALVLVVGAAVFGWNRMHKSPTTTTPTEPSPQSSPASSLEGNDDQYYAYLKTKFDSSQSPDERTQLMSQYNRKYPTGKHIGEATALSEAARADLSNLPVKEAREFIEAVKPWWKIASQFLSPVTSEEFFRLRESESQAYKELKQNRVWNFPNMTRQTMILKGDITQTALLFEMVRINYLGKNVEEMKEAMRKLNDALNSVQSKMSALTTE